MDNQNINPVPPVQPTPMAGPAPEPTAPAAPAPAPVAPTDAPATAAPMSAAAPEKKKSKVGLIIGIILGVLVLGGAIFGIIALLGNGGDEEDESIYDSNAFFLRDDNDHYALFNDEGERITEFDFSYAGNIIGGTALVRSAENDKSAIINSEGKILVGYDKYRYIERRGALYVGTDDNLDDHLLNSNGKELYVLKDNKLLTYDDSFAVVADSKGFQILNYRGKNVLSITENLDKDIHLSDEYDNTFVIVSHGTTNYVINSLTAEVTAQFESKSNFEVYGYDKDDNILLLRSEDGAGDKRTYKFIVKGEAKDLPGGCESVEYYSVSKVLSCTKDDKRFVLDSDLKISIEYSGGQFIDGGTYARNKDDKNYGITFYKDGAKVAEVSCRSFLTSGKANGGVYLAYTRYSSDCRKDGIEYSKYEYYSAEGKRLFGRYFDSASSFSVDGIARVREKDADEYSLINTSGEKVGVNHKYLYDTNIGEYTVYYGYDKTGDPYSIYSNKGKQIAKTATDSRSYPHGNVFKDKLYIYVTTGKDEFSIFRAEDGQKLATSEEYPTMRDHYFITENDSKVQYYTYDGKKIHENKGE